MTRLLAEAAQGDVNAFAALGDVRDIPTASASTLAEIAIAQIADQRDRARSGAGYELGGIDWGWWLAAINLCHPVTANWPALLEHFNDPLADPDHLTDPPAARYAHSRHPQLLRESTGSRDDGRLFALLRGTQPDRELAALCSVYGRTGPTPNTCRISLRPPIVRSGGADSASGRHTRSAATGCKNSSTTC
jgi:hypothetical protein